MPVADGRGTSPGALSLEPAGEVHLSPAAARASMRGEQHVATISPGAPEPCAPIARHGGRRRDRSLRAALTGRRGGAARRHRRAIAARHSATGAAAGRHRRGVLLAAGVA
jgi:hypothetical protein